MGGAQHQHRLGCDNRDNGIVRIPVHHIFHQRDGRNHRLQIREEVIFLHRIGFVGDFLLNSLAANNLPIEISFNQNKKQ